MRASINQERWGILASLLLLALLLSGCGGGRVTKTVEGTVTVSGQTPDSGEVRFIPIEGTPGSNNVGMIKDGKYRIQARGGIPLGKYRVEINAKKKTGRKVMQNNGFEEVMGDEIVKISPPLYSGKQSPLKFDVTPDFDGQFNIMIK